VTRASAPPRAGSVRPVPGGLTRAPALALAVTMLALGALLAVCCCVDSADDAPTGSTSAAPTVDVRSLGPAAAAPARFEPADSCDPYTSAVGGAALYRNLPSSAGDGPLAVPVSSPLGARSVFRARAVPAPPPAPPPSPYQLCVMRT
jgi:hypothetical protein